MFITDVDMFVKTLLTIVVVSVSIMLFALSSPVTSHQPIIRPDVNVDSISWSYGIYTPKNLTLTIIRSKNVMYLSVNDYIVREIIVSTGSGDSLIDSRDTTHIWHFVTPPGRYRVVRRETNPIWIKPDWAFIETGDSVPDSLDFVSRSQEGMLGAYAFYLGSGYAIHGTPYENLLGRSVTHGCVRVGKDDLEFLWRYVNIGTRVVIQ